MISWFCGNGNWCGCAVATVKTVAQPQDERATGSRAQSTAAVGAYSAVRVQEDQGGDASHREVVGQLPNPAFILFWDPRSKESEIE